MADRVCLTGGLACTHSLAFPFLFVVELDGVLCVVCVVVFVVFVVLCLFVFVLLLVVFVVFVVYVLCFIVVCCFMLFVIAYILFVWVRMNASGLVGRLTFSGLGQYWKAEQTCGGRLSLCL
jgi:hypothetical protein